MNKGEEALRYWQGVDVNMMSDVETDDDGNIVHRTLPWRNEDLTKLIEEIDKINKVLHVHGPSSRRMPLNDILPIYVKQGENLADHSSEEENAEEGYDEY